MSLPKWEKIRLRAEGALLYPQVVGGSREKDKYNDVAFFFLKYHNGFCPQTRDLFSAGSVVGGKGNSLIAAENFAAASCPATAGFSRQPRRAGVFENGVVEDRVAFGPASAFKSPAADIFYSTLYPSSRNRWSL